MTGVEGRWAGRARVPSGLSPQPVGVLRAVLIVAPARIELRVPPVVRTLLLMEDLNVLPGDAPVIFPAHQTGSLGPRGIAIEVTHFSSRYWQRRWGRLGARMPAYYFWTSRREQVLTAAAAAGFDVSGEEQSIEPRTTGD